MGVEKNALEDPERGFIPPEPAFSGFPEEATPIRGVPEQRVIGVQQYVYRKLLFKGRKF